LLTPSSVTIALGKTPVALTKIADHTADHHEIFALYALLLWL
jgi:hypothetical protein